MINTYLETTNIFLYKIYLFPNTNQLSIQYTLSNIFCIPTKYMVTPTKKKYLFQ